MLKNKIVLIEAKSDRLESKESNFIIKGVVACMLIPQDEASFKEAIDKVLLFYLTLLKEALEVEVNK